MATDSAGNANDNPVSLAVNDILFEGHKSVVVFDLVNGVSSNHDGGSGY